jgi:hypothetical protein
MDEQGQRYHSQVSIKCRDAHVGVAPPTTTQPCWLVSGVAAPHSASNEAAKLLVFDVTFNGTPMPELLFAVNVRAKARGAAKWCLQVVDVATGALVTSGAAPLDIAVRVAQADALGNVLNTHLSQQQLRDVRIEANDQALLSAVFGDEKYKERSAILLPLVQNASTLQCALSPQMLSSCLLVIRHNMFELSHLRAFQHVLSELPEGCWSCHACILCKTRLLADLLPGGIPLAGSRLLQH